MIIHPANLSQFYLTAPAPCPYIEGNWERKIFTHLAGEQAQTQHDHLSDSGFRRSQHIAYRPACETCHACIATRILVKNFSPTRSMRRVINRNKDLIGTPVANTITAEQYDLFKSYILSRHNDSGMAEMSVHDYKMMVEDSSVDTFLVEFRKRGPDSAITGKGVGELIAVSLVDQLTNGLSMVYSFFKPDQEQRSLGTFMILEHIERAKDMGLKHCHLGYWIKQSSQMAYKSRFLPQERLIFNAWVEYTE